VHLEDGGAGLDSVQLNDVESREEFARRVAAFARTRTEGQWILRGNWDETKYPGHEWPTREWIDGVTAGHPALLGRYDGHSALANTKALALAGITRETKDPSGGVIVRDERGEATGVLKESAIDLVQSVVPMPSVTERKVALELALKYAASLGVTSLQDMTASPDDFVALSDLLREGKLTARVYVGFPLARLEDLTRVGISHAFGSPFLRIGQLKVFADGDLGSRTAYFHEPYSVQSDQRGLLARDMLPHDAILAKLLAADRAHLQVATHAIGDAAISEILSLYATTFAARGPDDRRWRVEHAQHMAASDFDRFAELGVIASVQPTQAIDDGRWVRAILGGDREARTHAYRSFLAHGVKVALGTDWPVVSLNPMTTLYAATTRRTLDERHPDGWLPEQKLSIAEALALHTQGSAYAEFQETEKGVLRPGQWADFIMLSDDILTVPGQKLLETRCLATWVGGRRVFLAGDVNE
jgi:hypothetical protein